MNREWWTALVDACVLAVSLILPEFVDARWADILLKVVAGFQPVVVGYILAANAARIKAEVGAEVRQVIRELRRE